MQTKSGSHTAIYDLILQTPFPGIELPEWEFDHLFPSRAVVKTERRHMICPLSLYGAAMFNYILLHFKNRRAEVFCIKALRIPNTLIHLLSNPMFTRPKAWSVAARLLGLRVRILLGACMFVSCECCVLSGRRLWDGPITRPGESYRMWCVWMWSWSLHNEEALVH